eukprot:GCRY01005014.1.p1 GENE.GCRY01005014.1~~GCRY01005014.1.p1  ORF type:complete len:299 (+),score=52.81 GCRY01005014.1:144-1040(+)
MSGKTIAVDIVNDLNKGIEKDDLATILQSLKRFETVSINKSILKETNAGRVVAKLKKHDSKEVASLASALVASWKKAVDQEKQAETKDSETPKIDTSISTPMKESASASSLGSLSTPSTPTTPNLDLSLPASKSTGSKNRDNFIITLAKDLILDGVREGDRDPIDLMIELEKICFTKYPPIRYKAKFRAFHFNFKDEKNPALRRRLLGSPIEMDLVAEWESADMISSELQAYNAKAQKNELEKILPDWDADKATTDQFQCGKCKKRKCKFYQLQTRSADEPMTTFVTCVNCGNRWKFS